MEIRFYCKNEICNNDRKWLLAKGDLFCTEYSYRNSIGIIKYFLISRIYQREQNCDLCVCTSYSLIFNIYKNTELRFTIQSSLLQHTYEIFLSPLYFCRMPLIFLIKHKSWNIAQNLELIALSIDVAHWFFCSNQTLYRFYNFKQQVTSSLCYISK